MKKLFILSAILVGAACSNQKSANDAPKLKCDSVSVAMYDSAGNEIMVKELKCDTIKE